jgi:hypothetical protein
MTESARRQAQKGHEMAKYTTALVTCYCGEKNIVTVGTSTKCRCGVDLHVQQKKGGGHVWGTTPSRKRTLFSKTYQLTQNGQSQLEAEWLA